MNIANKKPAWEFVINIFVYNYIVIHGFLFILECCYASQTGFCFHVALLELRRRLFD